MKFIDLLHAVSVFGWANRLMQNLGGAGAGGLTANGQNAAWQKAPAERETL